MADPIQEDPDNAFDGVADEPIDHGGAADDVPPEAGVAALPSRAVAAAPTCPYCQQLASLVGGKVIYPHLPELAERWFWQCAPCGAWVGTHKGTQVSLGTPAKADLRRARNALHTQMLNPLWETAPDCGAYDYALGDARARKKIQRSAENRVYAFLADKLGLSREETHVGKFTIEQCGAARAALVGVSFLEIRDWYKQKLGPVDTRPRTSAPQEAQPRPPGPSRNKPCPCGSGVIYKKCCAPDADEVVRRAAAQGSSRAPASSAAGEAPTIPSPPAAGGVPDAADVTRSSTASP